MVGPERKVNRRKPDETRLTDDEQDVIKHAYFGGRRAECPRDGSCLEVHEEGRMGLRTPDLRVLCPLCGLEDNIPGLAG